MLKKYGDRGKYPFVSSFPLLLLLYILYYLSTQFVVAKNLSENYGIGATVSDFPNATLFSIRYGISQYSTVNFLGGLNTKDGQSVYSIGSNIYRHFFMEENMNFSLGVGFLYFSANTYSLWELSGRICFEFFLSGLSHLGFIMETGVGMTKDPITSFRILGNRFLNFGIHYYF